MVSIEVFRDCEERVARHPGVQAALSAKAAEIHAMAEAERANQAKHPFSKGESTITVERGSIDRGIVITDTHPWQVAAEGGRVGVGRILLEVLEAL